jgi:hypothetical protein
MALYVLRDCEALAVLRFRHQGLYFMKPGVFAKISICEVLHVRQSVGLLNAKQVIASGMGNGRGARVTARPTLQDSTLLSRTPCSMLSRISL